MLRNQKYHQEDECARFIREDYEKEQQKKIKEAEEEEKRAERVRELQRQRAKDKREKAAAQAKPKAPIRAPAKVPRSNINASKYKPNNKPPGGGRALPDYMNANIGSSSSGTGVSTRSKAKNQSNISSSYKPSMRSGNKRSYGKPKEEVKNEQKPITRSSYKKAAPKKSKPKVPDRDIEMNDPAVMDEIPAELLNQIYSQDLDYVDVERLQNQEYQPPAPSNTAPMDNNQPQQLLGGDVDMEFEDQQPEMRPPPRRNRSPPPVSSQNRMPEGMEESENELIQKAIAESLKEDGSRMHPMQDPFDSTMDDPEIMEAIARSYQYQ